MIRIIAITLFLVTSFTSFSQSAAIPAKTVDTDYLQKSKKQKKTAWLILGGGLACSLVGSILSTELEVDGDTEPLLGDFASTTGTILNVTGVCAMAGSIPLFIAAHRNKKKAMSLSFKNEKAPQFRHGSFTSIAIPSLTLKVSL